MTRQNFWRVLTLVITLTIMIAGWNSLAQSVPGQIEDLDGTLLSNNLALPSPLQVPLPLRFEALSVLGGNPPSAITSSTPLPSSLPNNPSAAVSTRTSSSIAPVSPPSVALAAKPSGASSNPKPSTSSSKPSVASTAKTSATPKPSVKATLKPKTKPRTTTSSRVSTLSSRSGPSYFLKSTAYNSSVSQTDSSPRVTATGARTRFGVIALSRDMLRSIPYGSQVTLEDMGSLGSGAGRGRFNSMLAGVVFIVEDTMNVRISRTVDVWFHSRSMAMRWGKRQVKLTILRYGRR
jgi:3D (Asp-Asp-Asp) domain-containing protein